MLTDGERQHNKKPKLFSTSKEKNVTAKRIRDGLVLIQTVLIDD